MSRRLSVTSGLLVASLLGSSGVVSATVVHEQESVVADAIESSPSESSVDTSAPVESIDSAESIEDAFAKRAWLREQVSAKIVGGSPIQISSAPWQVVLADVDDYWANGSLPFCGGSIIAPQWVLTAAHCVDDPFTWPILPYLHVGVGVTSIAPIATQSLFKVESITVHPNYQPGSEVNDVALLKVSSSVDLTSRGRGSSIFLPVSMPPTWPADGSPSLITGWGSTVGGGNMTSSLRGATVQVMASPDVETCGGYGDDYDRTTMLCAGLPGGGKDTCQGDSGGPLAISHRGIWILAGVTSFGTGCALPNYPGIYARVTTYIDWIRSFVDLPYAEAPENLDVVPKNGALEVSVTAPSPGSTAITNYAYSIDGGLKWVALKPASVSGTFTIQKLTNGRSYDVSVRAINRSGMGLSSEVVSSTPQPTPPGAPSIESITPGAGSLTVKLRAPTDTGGASISGYQVKLDGGEWSTVPISRSQFTVSGLDNGVSYSVSIRAMNTMGPGLESAARTATPRTVPDAPEIAGVVRGSGTATISFSSPPFDGGAVITNYEYSLNGGKWTSRRPASISSPLSISRLRNGTAYSVRIRAVNAAGPGAPSIPFGF